MAFLPFTLFLLNIIICLLILPCLRRHIEACGLQKRNRASFSSSTTMAGQPDYPEKLSNNKTIQNVNCLEKVKNIDPQAWCNSNVADDIRKAFQMPTYNNFVKYAINYDKGPIFILYTDNQMIDMMSCLKNGSVLGIDKTLKFSPYVISTFTYKSNKVISRETNNSPVMIGPMMIHCDRSFDTYQMFCSIVRTAIIGGDDNISINSLLGEGISVGSDEEEVMMKSLEDIFPESTQFVCTKDLKFKVNNYLRNKVRAPNDLRQEILMKIFGEEGIIDANSTIDFEERVKEFTAVSEPVSKYPLFLDYFNNKLKSTLLDNVIKPQIKTGKKRWTNNNGKSVSRILNQDADWKTLKLPDLIEKLEGLIKVRLIDMRRCMLNTGNYELKPDFEKFAIPVSEWIKLSNEEKEANFVELLSATVTSY